MRPIWFAVSVLVCIAACKHKPEELPAAAINGSNYPAQVAAIIVNKCATAGCHNEASYTAAGGLRLDKWEHLMSGGNNGAVVVPYSPQHSSLLYYTNTDKALGLVAVPTMPVNAAPLTRDEYLTLQAWITNGAPDKNGNIPFAAEAATRQKHYMTMLNCDKLAVIDGEKRVVSRYIEVGADPTKLERPHSVRFSGDGRFAFVCFARGEYVQKIDATTDKIVQQVHIGAGNWNITCPSHDGSMALVSDVTNGKVAFVNFETGYTYSHTGFKQPHGIVAADKSFRNFYITGERSNGLYKLSFDAQRVFSKIKRIALANDTFRYVPSMDAHELLLSPDGSKLFASCQGSNDVRVLNTANDSLVTSLPSIIPVGGNPLEMAMSHKMPYLFVTCKSEPGPTIGNAKFIGAVYVINYNTHQLVGKLEGNFSDPHGIVVDDRHGIVYVAHTNADPGGPDAHHASNCDGRNGYYTAYDVQTLKLVSGKRYEVLPYPYGFDSRFK